MFYSTWVKNINFCSYVLLNQSGSPLIFKQEGVVNETTGQTHEHELAWNREPLLFSFSDQEASMHLLWKLVQVYIEMMMVVHYGLNILV